MTRPLANIGVLVRLKIIEKSILFSLMSNKQVKSCQCDGKLGFLINEQITGNIHNPFVNSEMINTINQQKCGTPYAIFCQKWLCSDNGKHLSYKIKINAICTPLINVQLICKGILYCVVGFHLNCLPSLKEIDFLESGNMADNLSSILFIATLTRSAADPWTVVLTACLSACD